MKDSVKVLTLIVGLAIVAVVVVNGSKTAGVITAFFGGFGNSVAAASKG